MSRLLTYFTFCLMLFINNCSPKLSRYFDSTHFIESTYTFVVNDSLTLSLKVPGDIWFIQNKEKVIELVQQQNMNPNNLLAYGMTEISPHYRIFIWINPEHTIKPAVKYGMVRDTVLQYNEVILACSTKKEGNFDSLKSDCEEIFESITAGNNYRKEIPTVVNLRKRIGNRYLAGLKTMRSYPAKSRVVNSIHYQLATTYATFMAPNDIFKKLLKRRPSLSPRNSIKQAIRKHSIKGRQAVFQTVIKEAKDEQIVIFNESHYRPNHRILITELLPAFKKMGFEYLALEALWYEADSLLNRGQPPTIKMGFYTRGPHYGQLMRTAQALGFTLVKYESFGKKRELEQAENLYAGTFAQDKNAKILVLCGWAHILEKPGRGGKKRMALLFKKKYGINPLTISQTHLIAYSFMAEPLSIIRSSVFKQFKYNNVDLILLNNLKLLEPNSNFHFTNTFNKSVQPALFIKQEVKKLNGISKAIPYRTGLAKGGETLHFKLPPNEYILFVFSNEGTILKRKEITLN